MIKKILFFAAVLCLAFGCSSEKSIYEYDLFETEIGWGYEIKTDGEPFIRQEFVPAVSGMQGFGTKKQAEQAAKLVIEKMKDHELPAVTKEEMEAILRK